MASPMHCLVCDCRAKSQQQPTPSAYGCQSRMMSQTPYRQKGRIMRYRKTLLLIRHYYSNGNVKGTCTTSSYGLRLLHQLLRQHRFHQRYNPCLHPSLPSRVSHTHHRQLTMIPALRPCKRVVRFSRLIRHSLSCYLRLQISGLHNNTISHCRTGLLITVLRLLDSNQTWSSVKMVLVCGQMAVLRQRAFLYRPRYSALFSTVCIVSHTQGWRPDWCLSNGPTGGKASAKMSQGGQNPVQLFKKRRFMSTRKCHLNDCRRRLNASAIFTSI